MIEQAPISTPPESVETPKPPLIEIPDGLLDDQQLERIAAKTAASIVNQGENEGGRSGLGTIAVDMPADPSRVAGWNGITKR